MGTDAVRWSCARCEVSVGRIDGEVAELPTAWSRTGGMIYCLTCSRALAGEAAMESAPDSSSREERVRLRRTALIEFEIGRSPEAPNQMIARACRTSTATVAAVRNGLEKTAAPDTGARAGA